MTSQSPKNKFRAQLNYGKNIKGVGSTISFTADKVDNEHPFILNHLDTAKKNKTSLQIVWSENQAEYPSFDWVEVQKSYLIK